MNTVKELKKLRNGKELDIRYPIRLYDNDGREVYYEDSTGYWRKSKYKEGKQVYFEGSDGYWYKSEYKDGKQVYYENADGYIDDNR